MIKEIMADADLRMTRSVEVLRHELTKIRTGKASTGLVEQIKVQAYGNEMPITQVASISTPDARTIMITPWDKATLKDIEKALQKSDIGINPSNDGAVIRLILPPLTEERRKDLVKLVKKYVEDDKVAIRNVRRDANEHIKRLEKAHEVSEDESHKSQDEIQKLTEKHIKELDHLFELKEKEVMEV
jgi:ribosome recycling factor